MRDVETLWANFKSPIVSADDYLASLRGRSMNVFFMGQRVTEPVDHPVIFPSINAMAETYRLASEHPELAAVKSDIAGGLTNRFLHVPRKPDDLVRKHEMQRELGRRTGTCFQRCVGMDAISSCHSVTFDVDAEHGTDYHRRFLAFLKRAQVANIVIGGAMTDPKGDRSKPPHQQVDPNLFLHVIHRDESGIYVSGAKMHQTGAVNSHWLIFMPTMRMTEADREWSVVGAGKLENGLLIRDDPGELPFEGKLGNRVAARRLQEVRPSCLGRLGRSQCLRPRLVSVRPIRLKLAVPTSSLDRWPQAQTKPAEWCELLHTGR